MNEQTNHRPRIEPQATVVLYEQKTGEIVAFHHFAAVPGANIPDRKEMEDITLRSASEGDAGGKISLDALAILFVDPSEIEQGADYCVSEDQQLIATRAEGADQPSSA